MSNRTSKLKLIIAGENKGAVSAVRGIGKEVTGLEGKLGGLATGLGGALSLGSVVAIGKKALDSWEQQVGAVSALKRITGATAEDASLMAFAAQQSGVDATKAAQGWKILAKNIENGKVAAEGIATTDDQGNLLAFDKILGNVADRFKELPPGIERTALAQKFLGRGGADMVKILAKGADGIEAQREEMQKYGLEFTDANLEKFQRFIETQRDIKAALLGIQVAIGEKVAPAVTFLSDKFLDLPGPVRDGVLAVGGLGAAVGTLALGVGLLGPALARGASTLGIWKGATAAATAVTEAEAVAAFEAAGAEGTLAAAWAAGTPLAEGATAARSGLAAATEAEALAATEASTANKGLAASFGPIALAVAAAIGLYKGFQQATDGVTGSLEVSGDLLGETDRKLAATAIALDKFGGDTDKFKGIEGGLPVLKAMQAALAKYGEDSIPALDSAIRQLEGEQTRANKRTAEYGTTTDETAGSVSDLTDEIKDNADAYGTQADAVAEAVGKVNDQRDAQHQVADAHRSTTEAQDELAESLRAAAGDSEEYRDALVSIADAKSDVVDAEEAARDAVREVDDARVEARKHLEELADAEIQANERRRDSLLSLHKAEAEARRVEADPRATALDREEAQVNLANAKDDVALAEREHTQAVQDNLAAQRAGIEGDKGVVDAKAKVAEANDHVREAIDKVAVAEGKARDVLVDAKAKVAEAVQAVSDAQFAEAKAWGDLITLQQDATAGALGYLQVLQALGADPAFVALLQGAIGGVLPGRGSGELANGRPSPHAPGSPARIIEHHTTNNITTILQGTPKQTVRAQQAATRTELDRLARAAGGG